MALTKKQAREINREFPLEELKVHTHLLTTPTTPGASIKDLIDEISKKTMESHQSVGKALGISRSTVPRAMSYDGSLLSTQTIESIQDSTGIEKTILLYMNVNRALSERDKELVERHAPIYATPGNNAVSSLIEVDPVSFLSAQTPIEKLGLIRRWASKNSQPAKHLPLVTNDHQFYYLVQEGSGVERLLAPSDVTPEYAPNTRQIMPASTLLMEVIDSGDLKEDDWVLVQFTDALITEDASRPSVIGPAQIMQYKKDGEQYEEGTGIDYFESLDRGKPVKVVNYFSSKDREAKRLILARAIRVVNFDL